MYGDGGGGRTPEDDSNCLLFQQLKSFLAALGVDTPTPSQTRPALPILQRYASLARIPFGLSTVFVVSFISATLLPLGSEPVVFGLVELNPSLFWPAVGVATVGNTLGGAVSWWMGLASHQVVDRY
eukprot:gene26218-47465_t